MEDIERIIDDNDNLVYDDSVDPSQSTTSLTIGSISTDEGVIAPLGIGEMTVRVRYQETGKAHKNVAAPFPL